MTYLIETFGKAIGIVFIPFRFKNIPSKCCENVEYGWRVNGYESRYIFKLSTSIAHFLLLVNPHQNDLAV